MIHACLIFLKKLSPLLVNEAFSLFVDMFELLLEMQDYGR